MLETTKAQRRRLRELAALAHERALALELTELEAQFGRWRAGEIDPFELEQRIHDFHQGPARKLYAQYRDGDPEWAVVAAIRQGVVQREEAGDEVIQVVGKFLE